MDTELPSTTYRLPFRPGFCDDSPYLPISTGEPVNQKPAPAISEDTDKPANTSIMRPKSTRGIEGTMHTMLNRCAVLTGLVLNICRVSKILFRGRIAE